MLTQTPQIHSIIFAGVKPPQKKIFQGGGLTPSNYGNLKSLILAILYGIFQINL